MVEVTDTRWIPPSKPRVAFTLIGGKSWTGGYNYLLNLLQVLSRIHPDSLYPVLFAGVDVPAAELSPFESINNCEVVRDSVFNEVSRSRLLLRSLLLGRDAAAHAALRRERIDMVFESAVYLGWRLEQPAIAWIPDLQHRFLPHLFSRSAWWKREVGFRAQMASGRTIMCSSEDTQHAIERLYPSCKGRVRAVRFATQAPSKQLTPSARDVADRYDLPQQYFFMPNQFWVHKNHRLVLDALTLLAENGHSVTVFASGVQSDPRSPGHVSQLLADIKAAGLRDQFITPGLLPYADIAPLLQASVGLLNPSLFEGWSTTVEEAKAAGVPMLLSDIAVHREQAASAAEYFDPKSAESLASAMTQFLSRTLSDPSVRKSCRQRTSLSISSPPVCRRLCQHHS